MDDLPSEGAEPGAICGPDGDCSDGDCDVRWGNFCRVPCRRDDDCGDAALCGTFVDGEKACLLDCAEAECPNGWACLGDIDERLCLPDCRLLGCPNADECDEKTGACSTGPICSEEVCNGEDDDCDGEVDEELLNACGACGDLPEEECNGEDDDCDGEVDEGVLNSCGACGSVPREVCNGEDDDCDGEVDERVLNACGECGDAPAEVCNGLDDDCDGRVDEGVVNACGACGDAPLDECDGEDDDCDGEVDEDADCPDGEGCLDGVCEALVGAAEPCEEDEECASDDCWTADDTGRPGGFCAEECNRDEDCGDEDLLCALTDDGDALCQQGCDFFEQNCRVGWVCDFSPDDHDVCLPDCQATGCADDEFCDEFTGHCEVQRVRITLNQVFIAPGKPDGDAWDGFGSVPEGFRAAVRAALRNADPRLALLEVFADPALEALAKPDPFGSARLLGAQFDPDDEAVELRFFQDAFHPQYDVGWECVAFGPDDDLELSFRLLDSDLVNDDSIGTAIIGTEELRAALRDGGLHSVSLIAQGDGSLLLASISVSRDACE